MMRFFIAMLAMCGLAACVATDDPIAFDNAVMTDDIVQDQATPADEDVLPTDELQTDDAIVDELLADEAADDSAVDETPDVDNAPKPPAPTNFTGSIVDTTIVLNWQNPTAEGFQEVRLVRNETALPTGPEDGETLYTGTEETYTFAGPAITGTTYYFALFAYYGELGYSDPATKAVTSCYSKLDIVFVMDVSTTMEYILQTLHDQMQNVWDASVALNVDPKVGLVVFVDDVTAANDGLFFDTLVGVQGGFADWIEFIQTYGNKNTLPTTTGYNTDMPENTLDALATAVDAFPWRDINKTLRVVIHATDDTFLEKPAKFKSNVEVQHTYDETVTLLTVAQVRVGTFAAKQAERPTIEEPSGWKDITAGYFADYNGKPSIPEATGGAAYDLDLVGQPAPDGISMDIAINEFIENKLCMPY